MTIRQTGEEKMYWDNKQRQAHSLHEISYRACFKPELPRYFILNFTKKGDTVLDPFAGRGTTAIEAALNERKIISNDINPLSEILSKPRINPPDLSEIEIRLSKIKQHPLDVNEQKCHLDLSPFYHKDTEIEIRRIKEYLINRKNNNQEDSVDQWIRMVATNRLTGHSTGFFSGYTLPPNQAVSIERQKQINEKLGKTPEFKDVYALILKKSKNLLSDLTPQDKERLRIAAKDAIFLQNRAQSLVGVSDSSVDLVVTSPPFLNVVDYVKDNWLRLWFNNIDAESIKKNISVTSSVEDWKIEMKASLQELYRVVKPGGYVAFEVGEVRHGKIRLDELVRPIGEDVGFVTHETIIQSADFTKTSHIWGISNGKKGTNSNRVVLFKKS